MTVGSKSMQIALGTCLPFPVSEKKVVNDSSWMHPFPATGLAPSAELINPSGLIPCSRQYNSQHAFPIWTPAWPTWTEITSRCNKTKNQVSSYLTSTRWNVKWDHHNAQLSWLTARTLLFNMTNGSFFCGTSIKSRNCKSKHLWWTNWNAKTYVHWNSQIPMIDN